ncbi:MAG: hypothetical protein II605_02890 [Paludibacteraceae bacterium]|nr:hypothetical protein [Paludibacteraceae bacterium]
MKKGVKTTLKAIGWTILGLVLAVVVTACVAIYIVFAPEHLTPIARQAAEKYITCEHEIGEVELTFFSTFPRFGLRADKLLLINPMEGAQNDTVVYAQHLTATVDVMEFINNKNLHIYEAVLDEAAVHFYIAPDGTTNLSGVFVTSPDTVQEEDTTAFSLPFDQLTVDGLRLQAKAISFVDDKDTITASLGATELCARAANWDDMLLTLDAKDVCATLQGESYADSLHLHIHAPMAMNLDSMHFAFDEAKVAINEFEAGLHGDVTLGDSIDMNVRLTTGTWDIESLLALVPERFTKSIASYKLKGSILLDATAQGTYSDTQMPVVTLHKAQAQLWNSRLEAKGTISNIQSDILLDLQADIDAHLPDFKAFLPKGMKLSGEAQGPAKAKIRLSDLSEMRLHKGLISADLDLKDIHYAQDSMVANLPRTHARIQIPNSRPSKPKVNWARMDIETDKIDFLMGESTHAMIDAPVIHAEVANILNKQQEYFASIRFDALDAKYDTIFADMHASELEAYIEGGQKIRAKLKTTALNAKMGEELKAKTDSLALEVGARYNAQGENALLKWNPRLKINLKNGELYMPDRLPETVYIPSIEFSYSNRKMEIANSRIELGNSDLNLKGYVRHIGKWFRHEEVLEGELEIVSNHCDANQLLAWFSADSGSEEEPSAESPEPKAESQEPKAESEPFLVPKDVNLALHTHMKEVVIFNQIAKDLKGGIYVQDGTLILDEVGFVCRAAKLQLTAMYRTPRRNHLYLGMDYHMIDVDIDELLTMIPNLEQMVPMLSAFKGAAEFHLAAETYLNSQYQPKMSTLRGAAALTAKDLVVLDGETFDKISKLLLFNKKTVNKIDSINAEITIYKNEIDVYPLCVQMDNYMVALGGRHNTNMTFDYDINVLSPIYLGVNVSGTMDDLQIKLAKCKFAQDFKPHWYQKADTQSRELRERIKKSMEKNVRIR